jgi:hypothetical protein
MGTLFMFTIVHVQYSGPVGRAKRGGRGTTSKEIYEAHSSKDMFSFYAHEPIA